jgi:hypothetical protein
MYFLMLTFGYNINNKGLFLLTLLFFIKILFDLPQRDQEKIKTWQTQLTTRTPRNIFKSDLCYEALNGKCHQVCFK